MTLLPLKRRNRLGCRPWLLAAVTSLTLFCGGLARADVHPVPLDKNADPAKCASCHENNKVKGSSSLGDSAGM